MLRFIGGMIALSGCSSAGPYQYSRFHNEHFDAESEQIETQVGEENPRLDQIATVLGYPAKLIPFSSKINTHQLTPETQEKLKTYLVQNDLTDVCIYINHYAPRDQWRRLAQNKRMSPAWKYTFGAGRWVADSLVPGRVFGGDEYNPYTNTLMVNSDAPAVLLYEAAFAKDVHSRRYPGAYASVNQLPVLSLWRQTIAAKDVIRYAQTRHDWTVEEEAYTVLFPIIGAEFFLAADPFLELSPWFTPALALTGAVAGHATGRVTAAVRANEIKRAQADESLHVQLTSNTTEKTARGQRDDNQRSRSLERDPGH